MCCPDGTCQRCLENSKREPFIVRVSEPPNEPTDNIREAAIEAAAEAIRKLRTTDNVAIARAAIDAYERAMWIKGEPPKVVGARYLCIDETGDVARVLSWGGRPVSWYSGQTEYDWIFDCFRPLPKPPEQKP